MPETDDEMNGLKVWSKILFALLIVGMPLLAWNKYSGWWMVGYGVLLFGSLNGLAGAKLSLEHGIGLMLADIALIVTTLVGIWWTSAWIPTVQLVIGIMAGGCLQNLWEEQKKQREQKASATQNSEADDSAEDEECEDEEEDDSGEEEECEDEEEDDSGEEEEENEDKSTGMGSGHDRMRDDDKHQYLNCRKSDKAKNVNHNNEHDDLGKMKMIKDDFSHMTDMQLYHVILNKGSSSDDIEISKEILVERNALSIIKLLQQNDSNNEKE